MNRHGGFCHTHPYPSGGQAPALHFRIPAPWIPAFAGMINGGPETTSGGAVECGHNRGRVTSSRIGVRDMLSYQSLMPAGAGTSGCEDPKFWFSSVNRRGGFCHTHPYPSGGQAPTTALHYFVDDAMPIDI